MNFFYEATDSSGQTVMGRLDAGSEQEVRQRLQQMGYMPQAIAPNPQAGTPQTFDSRAMAQPASTVPRHIEPTRSFGAPAANLQSPLPVAPQAHRSGGIILSGNAARMTGPSQAAASSGSIGGATAPSDVSPLGGVNDRERLFFFQQLASLVKSGITIYAALDNLGPRTQNQNLSLATKEMADSARNGGRISDVMERYPRIFEEHITGLVRAGELGGFLEISLSEIALSYEQNLALYKGSWLPKVMATQGLYLLALAIPLFPDLLCNARLETGIMPGVRQYLIHEAILLPATFVLLQVIKLAWGRLQLPQWRRLRDSMSLRIPPYGDLHRQAALAAFIRMLRRLYHAGILPAAAWEGAMQTASNVVIRERLAASYEMMQRGETLPKAFEATGLFNSNMEQLLVTGQLSGQVVESLDQIADHYQEMVTVAAEKSRRAMFRAGRVAMLVLGGVAILWLVRSCYDAQFNFVNTNFGD